MSVDRDSPLPLWAQVASELRSRVESGAYNERFPTDKELVEEFGVSRQTVRQAVNQLTQAGMISRQRGRGSQVITSEFEQTLGSMYSLFSAIENQGVDQRSEVIELGIDVNPEVSSQLGLDHDTPLVLVSRLRRAGDEPLAVDHAWLPKSIAEPLLDVDFSHTSLYEELRSECGVEIDEGVEHIHPVVLDDTDRELLELTGGPHAGFQIERIGRSAGRAIEFRLSHVRGDRYGFVVDWSTSSLAPMRMADRRGQDRD